MPPDSPTVLYALAKTALQEKLQNAIKLENLKTHAEAFSDIAYDSEYFRLAGSIGYNRTADYVVENLEALGDYYEIERQTYADVVEFFNEGAVTIDGEEVESQTFQFSKNATLEGLELIWVNAYGCNGVSNRHTALTILVTDRCRRKTFLPRSRATSASSREVLKAAPARLPSSQPTPVLLGPRL